MSNYFLTMMFFLTLSFMVLLFMFSKMSFSLNFLNKFLNLGLLIFLMVVVNTYSVMIQDMSKFMAVLMLLSFYSLFLMGFGYGVGKKLNLMIIFKVLADILLYVLMGYFYFFKMGSDLPSLVWLEGLQLGIESLLIFVFSTYSLLGLFGFWVYWGMEASYFVSVYMHSCGFVAMGLVVFLKMTSLEVSSFDKMKNFVYVMSVMSYLFFVGLFLTVKDLKKSFGYFSAASICFLFLILGVSPVMALMYFFLSSVIKMVMFELMSFINKSKSINWWFFFWLCVLNISNYSIFVMTPTLKVSGGYGDLLKGFMFLMFFFKIYYMILFLIKVLLIFEGCSIENYHNTMKKIVENYKYLLVSGLILLPLSLYYLNFNSGVFLVDLFLTKHLFFMFMYLLFLQTMFLSWFLFLLGEKFKEKVFIMGGLMESLKVLFKSCGSMMPDLGKVMIFSKTQNKKMAFDKGLHTQLVLLWVFMFLLLVFF